MRITTALKTVLATLAISTAIPALAQAPAGLVAGATIYDTAGAEVGKVASVTADTVVVDTGTNTIAIPPSSFGTTPKGPLLAATREQLNAAAQQAAAETKAKVMAALTPGAVIHGSGGTPVATVKAVEGDLVTAATANGEVRLPVTAFAIGGSGLAIGMTSTEFEAAVASAVAATATAAPAEAPAPSSGQ
jgi:preprotein translocase subunit YajC